MALSIRLTGYSRCPLCKQDVGYDKVTGEYLEPNSPTTLINHLTSRHARLGTRTYLQAKAFVDSLLIVTKVVATDQIDKNHLKMINLERQLDCLKVENENLQELVDMAQEPAIEKVS